MNATEEDGSCIDDPIGYDCQGNSVPEEFCGPGTVWNEEAGTCVQAVGGPGESYCGNYTVWNADTGFCEVVVLSGACFFDSNQDGVVNSVDLLNFLSAYGLTCE